jgi:hypothetical protein
MSIDLRARNTTAAAAVALQNVHCWHFAAQVCAWNFGGRWSNELALRRSVNPVSLYGERD